MRKAAEEAGRDPAAVRIYAEVVVAPDATAAEILSAVQVRAVTYFTIRDLGAQLIAMNGWDPAPMEQLLADPRFLNIEGQKGTHAELRERMKRGDRRAAAALARARCGRRQLLKPSRGACSSIAAPVPTKSCCTGPHRTVSGLWCERMASSELPLRASADRSRARSARSRRGSPRGCKSPDLRIVAWRSAGAGNSADTFFATVSGDLEGAGARHARW